MASAKRKQSFTQDTPHRKSFIISKIEQETGKIQNKQREHKRTTKERWTTMKYNLLATYNVRQLN